MTDAITVYEHPLSPYAQKVKLALREKSLPFSVTLPGFGGDEAVAEFAELSPQREVPVLVHNDQVLVESDHHPGVSRRNLAHTRAPPAGPSERARVRLLERNMDTHFEANTWGLGETLVFGRAQGKLAAQLTEHAACQIELWFLWLEAQLTCREWFNGAAFGYGDLCVIPHVNSAARFDLTPPPNSQLAQWGGESKCRDTVVLTQAEAVAAELDPATMQAAVAAGFQREYRDHRLEWMVRAGGLAVVDAGLAAQNIRFNGAPSRGDRGGGALEGPPGTGGYYLAGNCSPHAHHLGRRLTRRSSSMESFQLMSEAGNFLPGHVKPWTWWMQGILFLAPLFFLRHHLAPRFLIAAQILNSIAAYLVFVGKGSR